jgi:hypothetical protein
MSSRKFFAVMVVHPFSDVTVDDGKLEAPDGHPEHFLPVFESRAAAEEWADGASVVEIDAVCADIPSHELN